MLRQPRSLKGLESQKSQRNLSSAEAMGVGHSSWMASRLPEKPGSASSFKGEEGAAVRTIEVDARQEQVEDVRKALHRFGVPAIRTVGVPGNGRRTGFRRRGGTRLGRPICYHVLI